MSIWERMGFRGQGRPEDLEPAAAPAETAAPAELSLDEIQEQVSLILDQFAKMQPEIFGSALYLSRLENLIGTAHSEVQRLVLEPIRRQLQEVFQYQASRQKDFSSSEEYQSAKDRYKYVPAEFLKVSKNSEVQSTLLGLGRTQPEAIRKVA